jgi:hypothetical protein
MMFAMTFRKYCRAKHLQTKVLFRTVAVTEAFLTPVRRAVYLYCFCGFAVIIGSRLHYTLDVLAAIFLSYWAFRTYHDWSKLPELRKKFKLLKWLEADAVRHVDNTAYALAKRD